jgi:hypothetical protein
VAYLFILLSPPGNLVMHNVFYNFKWLESSKKIDHFIIYHLNTSALNYFLSNWLFWTAVSGPSPLGKLVTERHSVLGTVVTARLIAMLFDLLLNKYYQTEVLMRFLNLKTN